MWRTLRASRSEGARTFGEGLPVRGVCAHRGGTARRPENTLAAFRDAAEQGVHQIEFDVRRTADGEIVVMHDPTLERTTNGAGRVCDAKLADLCRLDAGSWFGPQFAGERVPTLAEALSVLPDDVWINIQVKRGEPVAGDVVFAVLDAGRLDQAIVSCGNQDARLARAVHPRIRICNLARQRTREAYVAHAIETGADFIQFHHLRGAMEPELAERARRAGLRVNFFCAPDPSAAELEALFDAGVDFVLVDDLERGLAAARARGIESLRRPSSPRSILSSAQPASSVG